MIIGEASILRLQIPKSGAAQMAVRPWWLRWCWKKLAVGVVLAVGSPESANQAWLRVFREVTCESSSNWWLGFLSFQKKCNVL